MGFTKKANWFCHLHKIDKKASGFKTTICSLLSQPQHSHVISDIFQCICAYLLCAHKYVGLSLQQYQFFCKSWPLLLLNQNSTQKWPQILKVFLSRWNYTVYQAKILIEMIEYLWRLESKSRCLDLSWFSVCCCPLEFKGSSANCACLYDLPFNNISPLPSISFLDQPGANLWMIWGHSLRALLWI